MKNEDTLENNMDLSDKEREVLLNKTENKKSFLGGYPVGEQEFFILVHFLGIVSFFVLFILTRILILAYEI